MKKGLLSGIVIVVLVVAVIFLVNQSNRTPQQTDKSSTLTPTSSPTSTPSAGGASPSVLPAQPGTYVDYASDNLLPQGTNIIFFAAKWCPSCNALDRDIKANIDKIPADVRIHKVDYDTANQLRKQYSITMQHILVQVDSAGREVRRWNGLYSIVTLNDLIKNIQSP